MIDFIKWLFGSKAEAKTVQPGKVVVNVGSLKIESDEQTAPRLGFVTRTWIDGNEIKNIRSLTLRIVADEVVTAELELNV